MDPSAVVTAFIAAFNRKEVESALLLCAEDVLYHNVPMRPMTGRDQVQAALGPFIGGCDAVDWVVHRQTATGNVVMNERNDRFQLKGRWADLAVLGVFEVNTEGLITLWRDYFDLAEFNKAMKG